MDPVDVAHRAAWVRLADLANSQEYSGFYLVSVNRGYIRHVQQWDIKAAASPVPGWEKEKL